MITSAVDTSYGKQSLNHLYRLLAGDTEAPLVAPPEIDQEVIDDAKDDLLAGKLLPCMTAWM